MKNNIKFIFLALILLSGTAFSQVGINTKNPQGVFNIDGGKDNPETGNAHTAEQQLNDLTVLDNGNMGLGTINPSHKVHIVTGGDATTPVRGFKLTDGNEGDQRVLATISGAGTFLVNNNKTVISIIITLSKANPLFCIKITAATEIKPPATAVIPFRDIFIPFICFRFSHIGYMKYIRSSPGRNIPIPPAAAPKI